MIGISVVTNYYECFEPSTKTFAGLMTLYSFVSSMNKDFQAKINILSFEDCELEPETFDFAITSPPYYNTEIYCDEETNSCNRYSDFDKWVDGFYLPLIEKTMTALKVGKVFILNIGSRVYPLNQILMDNFSGKYRITKEKNYLAGIAGLGKKGEGETFYVIKK